ncbi:xanthine dehydrogenase family protein molybdopterin-binding subunit [Hoeflea sp.]|uniref:xanthine dehydrogenase family protein molybdopterin-binding subunit n=1 Tax=Hoeflea sp. TaxID=1940281 RepID=UPI003B029885
MRDIHKIEIALHEGIVVSDSGHAVRLPDHGMGHPSRRMDGNEKVTGAARYAGEIMPRNVLHAVFVGAPIPKGRVAAFDASKTLDHPGVIRVLTHDDMPEFAQPAVPPFAQNLVPLGTEEIHYEGQPIAVVLAETLEAAEEGAALLAVECTADDFLTFENSTTQNPEGKAFSFQPLDVEAGDVESAISAADAVIDETYVTASRHHNMMEPHTTLAEWRGDHLHIWDASQWTYGIRYALAGIVGYDIEKITVICPFTGGGFGGKGYVWPHQVLVPVMARIVERPVKLSLGRAGCYTGNGYQPKIISSIRMASDASGRLVALDHTSENITSIDDYYIEFATAASRATYAVPNYRCQTRLRQAHVGTPTPMRAPHEGPGSFATESAIDELAYKLDIDPLEIRLKNHADNDLISGKPFSSKKLREAYKIGADRFGWDRRAAQTRAQVENGKLIGQGMATAVMATFRHLSAARVVLEANGNIVIEAGTQEVGTGVRTVLPQIAAEKLGVPLDRVRIELGSTSLVETAGTFGSGTSIGTGSAIAVASQNLLDRILQLSGGNEMPAYADWPDLLNQNGVERLSADGSYGPEGGGPFDAHGELSDFAMHSYGAIFVEVEVNEELGIARMRRAVGCYSAGRILNPATARSQMIGGIIWGYGRAMLENSAMDPAYGRYLSKNLSGVLVPVNADIPRNIDVSFVEEYDPHCSTIGVRGIGELGDVGVSAAITNAIYHACGRRVRELPVTFEHLLGD